MNEQQADSRRGAEGHIYIVEFSEGTVKVGFSTTPGKRMRQHAGHAAAFGISIARSWTSHPHLEAKVNERALIAWCSGRARVTRKSEYFAGLDYAELATFAGSLPMNRHTEAAFQVHERQTRRRSDVFIRFAKSGPVAAAPRVNIDSFDLSPGDHEQVLATARLCDLTIDSARVALSNDATRNVIHRFLDRAFDAYEAREVPLQPWVTSQWDYLISPHTDGKYYELINPLFEAAESLGIELNEQFHDDADAVTSGLDDAPAEARALPARDAAR